MPRVMTLLAPPRSRLGSEAEILRRNLPIHLYLNMLHTAAVQAYLPAYDADGEETHQEPVEVQDRLKLLQYLTDKALPPARGAIPEPLPPPPRAGTPVESLTEEELLAIVHSPDAAATGDEGAGEEGAGEEELSSLRPVHEPCPVPRRVVP